MYTKEEKAEIWLDSFHLDYGKKARLYQLAKHPLELARRFSSLRSEIEKIVGDAMCNALASSLETSEYVNGLMQTYAEKRIRCVSFSSPLYPELLRQIPDPPFVLYCRGKAELLRERKFAIVGSRRTLPQILRTAERYARDLSPYFSIVTGLADGGDSAVIAGALASGKLISVLAYGFDYVYPECNRVLLEKVEKQGLVLTEHLPDEAPRGFLFPARNRIIAGLCEGVLVISGGEKSGTRITADYAYSYGRDVFAFPYSLGVESGIGCNAILKEYAKLTDNLVDIADAFGINLTEAEEIRLTGAELAVYNSLKDGEAHISEIAERTGLKQHEISSVLMLLEMKKLAAPCGGNRWAAVK